MRRRYTKSGPCSKRGRFTRDARRTTICSRLHRHMGFRSDESVNGLDPEGIHWIRNLLKDLAAEGRTVFVSSHLMSEMALTADHLIVIGRGRLIADLSVDEFVRKASKNIVRVRSPQSSELRDLIVGPDVVVETVEPSVLEVIGLSAEQ